jgi:hypothetical protein
MHLSGSRLCKGQTGDRGCNIASMARLSIYPTSSNLTIDSSLASDLRLVCDHQPSARSNGSARSVQGIGCPPKAKGPVEAARCKEGLVSQDRTQPASHRVTRPRGKRLVALVASRRGSASSPFPAPRIGESCVCTICLDPPR